MDSCAILLARVLAFIETADLNPRGRVFYPELVRHVVERYNFQIFPKTPEQFDEQKGVEFHAGKIGDKVIEALKIFPTLLVLETRSNTNDSKAILEELLEWGRDTFGLTYRSEMVRHWGYVSTLTFHSDTPLIAASSSPLAKLASKTSTAISEIWKEPITYEPVIVGAGHDPTTRKNAIALFYIRFRDEIPFSENKYQSEAPLPTDAHIKLLEEFEADVLSQKVL